MNISYSNNNQHIINFTELLIIQNEILYQNLNSKFELINKYLTIFYQKKFTKNLKAVLSYNKINQIFKNNTLYFSTTKENIIFSDFIKLMNSRFGVILKNSDFITTPIYILNKTGEEAFNNVLAKQKLDSSQQVIYLMILDYKTFYNHFILITKEFMKNLKETKEKVKFIIYFFLNLNLFFIIVLIILLLTYIIIYLLTIFQILNDIYLNLKEKIGELSIKDIIRKKIDTTSLNK